MIDYSLILIINFPGKQWTLNGYEYSGLTWLDSTPQPTKEELDALWESTQLKYQANLNVEKAKKLLATTDWAILPDVNISNQSEYLEYRRILRSFISQPQSSVVFPTEPIPAWV